MQCARSKSSSTIEAVNKSRVIPVYLGKHALDNKVSATLQTCIKQAYIGATGLKHHVGAKKRTNWLPFTPHGHLSALASGNPAT
jgi:hypothetical protein